MRKIIGVTGLLFIALFTIPVKKKYILKKETNYIKTTIKLDVPDLIMGSTNENAVLQNRDSNITDVSTFYQTPKSDFSQNKTLTIKSKVSCRNQKGKMIYTQKPANTKLE